jgi:hypothetical protein
MSAASPFFTVCETATAIEIRAGCYESPDVRIICTCRSHEAARYVAQRLTQVNNLPLVDYVQAPDPKGCWSDAGLEKNPDPSD